MVGMTKLGMRNLYLMPFQAIFVLEAEFASFREGNVPRLKAAGVG
jgi:hypothetical protein